MLFPPLSARRLLHAVVLSGAATAVSGSTTQAQDLITRAERTDFVETSSYADVVAFTEAAAAADPRMHYTTFGYTSEGAGAPPDRRW